jgi:hypothetical protein
MNACAPPPDVALLLRAHSEQRWLSREVIPVVRQIETGERLPAEQLPAALAYLEVTWAEAAGLAREADAALRTLDTFDGIDEEGSGSPAGRLRHPHGARQPLPARARRYHASVRELRAAVARRVEELIAAPVAYAADSADRRADSLA